jgi:hypothetical protein
MDITEKRFFDFRQSRLCRMFASFSASRNSIPRAPEIKQSGPRAANPKQTLMIQDWLATKDRND